MTLKELRKKRGMTQEQLANRLGIARSLISKYENGKISPTITTAFRMAEILGCGIDEIVQALKPKGEQP